MLAPISESPSKREVAGSPPSYLRLKSLAPLQFRGELHLWHGDSEVFHVGGVSRKPYVDGCFHRDHFDPKTCTLLVSGEHKVSEWCCEKLRIEALYMGSLRVQR